MPYAICYYHIIWATKYRQPLITPAIEKIISDVICAKSQDLSCPIHAINMVSDHIHIAVSIRLSLSVAEWVRQMKSLSSLVVRREFEKTDESFRWQKSYSVYTFGKKILPFVTNYIENQKINHQNNTLEPYLEYIDEE